MAMEQREQTGGNHPYTLKKKDGPGVVLTFKRNFQKNYFENSTDFFLNSFISLLSSKAAFLARVPAALFPLLS